MPPTPDRDRTVHQLRRNATPLIGAVPPAVAAPAVPPSSCPWSLLVCCTDGLIETRDRDIDALVDSLAAAARRRTRAVRHAQLAA